MMIVSLQYINLCECLFNDFRQPIEVMRSEKRNSPNKFSNKKKIKSKFSERKNEILANHTNVETTKKENVHST